MKCFLAVEQQQERPLEILKKVDGNDICAECCCYNPDWASLKLIVKWRAFSTRFARLLDIGVSDLTIGQGLDEGAIDINFSEFSFQFCNLN
jgi:hypothetical protein